MVATTSRIQPSIEVFDEVMGGETGDGANQRRCQILRDVDREMPPGYAPRIRRGAESVQRYSHTPFCHRG